MDTPDAINDLNSRDLAVRRRAAEQLATHPDVAAAVSLARACGDADESVREWAVAALEQLGVPDAVDAAALTELLADEHHDVRYWAATLLGRLGRQAASAAGPLGETVGRDPETAVRQRAAWALGEIGPAAAAVRSILAQAAASDDPRLARLARQSLEKIAGS